MPTVLLVDDDAHLVRMTGLYLKRAGYTVEEAYDGETALRLYRARPQDMIVLDLMLPQMDGLTVCREIRRFSEVPVIMLTAKGEVEDRIGGLRLGADDYMVKPFDPNELVARIETVLRRTGAGRQAASREGLFRAGALTIDEHAYEAELNGRLLHLPRREFDLLLFFVKHPNQVFTRDDLVSRIWGWDFEGDARVVDLYVKRLRDKLADAFSEESDTGILTVRGVGYKFGAER